MVAPGRNIYLVNSPEPSNTKYSDKILALSSGSVEYQRTINDTDCYCAVMIHALTYQKIQIVNKIDKQVILVWFFWGADGYYLKKLYSKAYSEKTKRCLNKIDNSNAYKKIKGLILSYDFFSIPFSLIKYHRLPEDYERRLAIKRMNYCVPVIEDDYYLLKKNIRFCAQLINCNYGYIEKSTFGFQENISKEKFSVLVGNSGDPANNHFDILDALKEKNFDNNIISPLSYGNNDYIKHVVRYGKDLFGQQFIPLLDFIPLVEYNALVANCSIVIMNHYIQQAMGNIIFTLWRGAKLFINKKNTIYNFLKRNNAIFYTIEEDLSRPDAFTPLRDFEKEINRKFINNCFSEKEILKRATLLVEKITKN